MISARLGLARRTRVRPAGEKSVDPKILYGTRLYRRQPGRCDFAATVTNPSSAHPKGGVAIAIEGDRRIVTRPSAGRDLDELMKTSEPLGPPHRLRLPGSGQRRQGLQVADVKEGSR